MRPHDLAGSSPGCGRAGLAFTPQAPNAAPANITRGTVGNYSLGPKGVELEAALQEIGWSLQWVGCDSYHIVNHHGFETDFEYHGEMLELRGAVFGPNRHGSNGVAYCQLSACDIQVKSTDKGVGAGRKWVSIMSAMDHKGIFISFYNFDKSNISTKGEPCSVSSQKPSPAS